MRLSTRCRLGTFLLSVLAVAAAAGLLARGLRTRPRPHSHDGEGFILHNESRWAVTLLIEPPPSASGRVRLGACESLALPRRPERVQVLVRMAGPSGGRIDQSVAEIDFARSLVSSALDYGEIRMVTRRCLAVRMRLGAGAEAPVQ
jgi:hypothetical protein